MLCCTVGDGILRFIWLEAVESIKNHTGHVDFGNVHIRSRFTIIALFHYSTGAPAMSPRSVVPGPVSSLRLGVQSTNLWHTYCFTDHKRNNLGSYPLRRLLLVFLSSDITPATEYFVNAESHVTRRNHFRNPPLHPTPLLSTPLRYPKGAGESGDLTAEAEPLKST